MPRALAHYLRRYLLTLGFAAAALSANVTSSQAAAKCASFSLTDPDCFPLLSADGVKLIVDIENKSQGFGDIDAEYLLGAATQALREGLTAPANGRERPRTDLNVTGEVVEDLRAFTSPSSAAERAAVVILQCSIGDLEPLQVSTSATSLTCSTTWGNLTLNDGWVAGRALRQPEPSIALLTKAPAANSAAVRDVLRRSFEDLTRVLRSRR